MYYVCCIIPSGAIQDVMYGQISLCPPSKEGKALIYISDWLNVWSHFYLIPLTF